MTNPTVVQQLLATLAPTLRDLAAQTGIPYDTLRAWNSGVRFPSAANLERLAALAEERSGQLAGLAKELRTLASGRRSE